MDSYDATEPAIGCRIAAALGKSGRSRTYWHEHIPELVDLAVKEIMDGRDLMATCRMAMLASECEPHPTLPERYDWICDPYCSRWTRSVFYVSPSVANPSSKWALQFQQLMEYPNAGIGTKRRPSTSLWAWRRHASQAILDITPANWTSPRPICECPKVTAEHA